MPFLSKLYPNEKIVDEVNAHLYAPASDVIIDGEKFARGLELPAVKPREAPFLKQWDRPIIPRSEWAARIEEKERNKALISQIVRDLGIPTSNQNSTNFCWTYGVVTAINCMRARRGMPYVEFSRESVAAPIKGYRNNGGWGYEALKYISENGIMPQNLWPRHYYRSSEYNTSANKEVAKQFIVTHFLILQDRNFSQLMTALLEDEAVAVGYNRWSHEVCAIDPVVTGSNSFGVRIWNSWGNSYGDNGMAILAESYGPPDDAVIPVMQVAA